MKPRITAITICVDDLERSLRFYRDGFGLNTDGIVGTEFEYGAVVFFDLKAGLKWMPSWSKRVSKTKGIGIFYRGNISRRIAG